MLKLGVNVDHVATVRQARLAKFPSPVLAALECVKAGANGITAHLREDRRHIQDEDMRELKRRVPRLNMEMAVTEEMVRIAGEIKPAHCCLVPEKRQELTTEGGLDAVGSIEKVADAVKHLQSAGVIVSLFIDPDKKQIEAAKQVGADVIELHTGSFSNAVGEARKKELNRLIQGAELAHSLGLTVNAGHGIDYENMEMMLEVPWLNEMNIGHSIIARSIFTGLQNAVREMLALMARY